MENKVNWGVLSTAKIGRVHVIPGINKSSNGVVVAISSRNEQQAKDVAKHLNIEKAYGSYDQLLADTDIDAVYIPLPNHLHVEWAIKALRAGKHVLCEKPIGISAIQAETLHIEAEKHPNLKVMEGFMYRFHPQWQKVKSLLDNGVIGEVKTIHSFFSYFNIDPHNIRNKPEVAGGSLMDIGCYCIAFPRYLLNEEPSRVVGLIGRDSVMKTDRLTSAMMEFSGGKTSSFSCSTQLMPYQRVHVFGTEGHIEIEIPVNAPSEGRSKVWIRTNTRCEEMTIEAVDQYQIQAELMGKAILEDGPVPVNIVDAVQNMKVIDAIFKSAEVDGWIAID